MPVGVCAPLWTCSAGARRWEQGVNRWGEPAERPLARVWGVSALVQAIGDSLASVLDWARPQALPVTVVPGVEHFFHGRLPLLKALALRHLAAAPL